MLPFRRHRNRILHLRSLLAIALLFTQSGCFVAEFWKTSPISTSGPNGNDGLTCLTPGDLPTTGSVDPCFGNRTDEPGYFDFSLLTALLSPFYTTLSGTDDRSIGYLVTETDDEGALWVAYPHLSSNATDIHFQIVKLNPNQSASPTPVFYTDSSSSSGIAITDLLIDEKDSQAGLRYIYYAGTQHNNVDHGFLLCRLVEDLTTSQLSADITFNAGTSHCVSFSSSLLSLSGYSPQPASTDPVHIAFHLGSDSVRRVILIGNATSAGTDFITIIPVRVSDGTIGGAGAFNTITKLSFNTQFQGTSFDLIGMTSRSIRIFGFETDPQDGFSPANIYVGVEFLNDEDSAGTPGAFTNVNGTARAEHYLYRLDSSLAEAGFGQAFGPKSGVYIPAAPGSDPNTFLNNRPRSTATSLSSLKVSNGKIYVLGLHINQGDATLATASLGYKLLQFPTNASTSVATSTQAISTGTLCNLAANPALTVGQENLLVVGCSQSLAPEGNNFLIREHSTADLTVMDRMGETDDANALYTPGFDGLTQHSPSLNLFFDNELGGHVLYRGLISDSYPVIIRSWQD
jgi:hypothetical protein